MLSVSGVGILPVHPEVERTLSPYRLLIFDFDGTLSDSFHWFTSSLAALTERFKLAPVPPDEVEALRSYDSRQLLRRLNIRFWRIPRMARELRERMTLDADSIRLFAEAGPALEKLHAAGITLAIVSSNSEENVRRILGPELEAKIQFYQGGASLFGKTSKFRKVEKASGIPRAQTLCIGDERRDIYAARAGGYHAAAVTWGYATEAALVSLEPQWVFRSFDEMLEKLT